MLSFDTIFQATLRAADFTALRPVKSLTWEQNLIQFLVQTAPNKTHTHIKACQFVEVHFQHSTPAARQSPEEDDFGSPSVEWKMLGTAGACCHIYFLSFGLSKHWCAVGKTPERGHWKWQEQRHQHPALTCTDLILRFHFSLLWHPKQPSRFSPAETKRYQATSVWSWRPAACE